MVAPISLTDLAKTHAVLRARNDDASGGLTGKAIIAGGFVEACDQILDQWLIPPRGVDALIRDDAGNPWWLSAGWRRGGIGDQPGQPPAQTAHAQPAQSPRTTHRRRKRRRLFRLPPRHRPTGLTTAALGDPTWRIGAATPNSAAFIPAGEGHDAIHTGGSKALGKLLDWADRWRAPTAAPATPMCGPI